MNLILNWMSVLTTVVMFVLIREIKRMIKEIKDGKEDG